MNKSKLSVRWKKKQKKNRERKKGRNRFIKREKY